MEWQLPSSLDFVGKAKKRQKNINLRFWFLILWHSSIRPLQFYRLLLSRLAQASVSGAQSTFLKVMAMTTLVPMLMYGKVSQENYVELTAASAIPNKEIKSPQILRY